MRSFMGMRLSLTQYVGDKLSMLNIRSKSVNSQFIYNFLGTVVSSGVSFLTMPIFTRLLGATQYGNFSVYSSWVSIFTCFMGLSVYSSIGTGRLKFKEDYYSFRSSVLIEGSFFGVALVALALLGYGVIRKINDLPLIIYALILIEAFAAFVMTYVTTCWTHEKEGAKHFFIGLIKVVLTTALSLLFLFNWKPNLGELYYGRVFGMAFPQIFLAICMWVSIIKKKPIGYRKEYWLYGLSFGLPMIFHTLSHQVLTQSDRIMMESMGTNGVEIGIYSFFYSFTSILLTLRMALNNAWAPFYYDDLDRKEYEKLNKKIFNFCQVFVVLCGGFLMLSREVVKIFANDEYWAGMNILPVFVVMIYSIFTYQFYVNFEFYNAKPKIIATGTCATALANIVLNAILIPRYGMYGAAVASLLSYSILAMAHFAIVHFWKLQKYPLTSKPVFGGLIVVIMLCILYYVLKDLWVARWVLGVTLGVYLIVNIYKRKTIF